MNSEWLREWSKQDLACPGRSGCGSGIGSSRHEAQCSLRKSGTGVNQPAGTTSQGQMMAGGAVGGPQGY